MEEMRCFFGTKNFILTHRTTEDAMRTNQKTKKGPSTLAYPPAPFCAARRMECGPYVVDISTDMVLRTYKEIRIPEAVIELEAIDIFI